ncbi:sigma factor-like helix-turn-helix DNA-binding protein [Sphingomonas sp. PAMC 26621]|uniref:sigma-70 region 4 domain-containing protein n=1 Tax=Sphingomonas sp. PAMC 26621 TaxID=1112213 RepID=UPI0009DB5D89|nr:sigma-70 region 4 domain-containing protein [Sphingomonas sp. PAMC 26621]
MKGFRGLLGLDRLPEDAGGLERLEYAMLQIPRMDREIFLAHRLDHMGYPEIADASGFSVEKVERSIARALAVIDRALRLRVSPHLLPRRGRKDGDRSPSAECADFTAILSRRDPLMPILYRRCRPSKRYWRT